MKGGFVDRRHDEVHDLFTTLLKDACHDVEVQLHLQTLTAEKFDQQCQFLWWSSMDISAHGFWKRGQRAFFDVRVFNPLENSHLNLKLDTAFSSNENEKKRHYNQRLLLKSSRLPTALSCSHHMEEIAERPIKISHWSSPKGIREKAIGA